MQNNSLAKPKTQGNDKTRRQDMPKIQWGFWWLLGQKKPQMAKKFSLQSLECCSDRSSWSGGSFCCFHKGLVRARGLWWGPKGPELSSHLELWNQPSSSSKTILHGEEAARNGIKLNRTATTEIRREDPQKWTNRTRTFQQADSHVLEHYLNTLAGPHKVRATSCFESSGKWISPGNEQ